MRVLHVINTLSAGGAELHLLALCRAQRDRGLEPQVAFLREHVAQSRSLRSDFVKAGIPTIDLAAPSGFDPSYIPRLRGLVRRQRPALMHTHLPRADLGGAIVGGLAGIPVVMSVHHEYMDKGRHRALGPLLRWAYRRANAVVAISDSVHAWLLERVAARPERVSTVHYGIDTAPFAVPSDTGTRERWGLTRRPVIGSLGRLERRKGFETLIRATALLRQEFPEVVLLIGGHDPYGYIENLRRLIAEEDLGDAVRLLGFVKDPSSFLHAIDVFAFASVSEGFGQVTVEAMAARRPVVVTKVPPMTEIVRDGESGLLAEAQSPESFADALGSLLRDERSAKRLGEGGSERVRQHFNVPAMVDGTLRVYARALRGEAVH